MSSYGLHSGYSHPLLRSWQCIGLGDLSPNHLMLPVFVVEDLDAEQPVETMPGVSRMGPRRLVEYLRPLVKQGLRSVLLFPVTETEKSPTGEFGSSPRNPVVTALRLLKKELPSLLLACDVCLCAYTDHGHCGVLGADGYIDNARSLESLAAVARAFAEAGADVVAPSDMMDGRVKAIKDMLQSIGYINRVSVMSYSTKFASSFYGPFRDAAHSAPQFGDRKRYQLPAGSKGLGVRAADRDVEEGADFLMVKPGMAYLDMVAEIKKRHPNHPMAIYQVSGEFAMLYHASRAGAVGLRATLEETLTCMRRAGADIIISYYTPLLLRWMAAADDEEADAATKEFLGLKI